MTTSLVDPSADPVKKRVRKKGEPSRIFSFGAFQPTENLDLVIQQMKLAHNYRNALAKRELERREQVEAALRVVDPGIVVIDGELDTARKSYNDARDMYRTGNQKARERRDAPDEKMRLAQFKAVVVSFEKKLGAARAKAFKDSRWESLESPIRQWERGETAKIRTDFRSQGLYAGTLDKVADEMRATRRGPPPRIRPWIGDGKISVQIHAKMPLSGEDLLTTTEDEDTRIRLTIARRPGAAANSKRGDRKLAGTCMLRVGSLRAKPVWTKFEFVCHRELPADKQIKWVRLFRRRVGVTFRWEVQFTVSGRDWTRPDTKDAVGKVGLDIGWRVMEDGRLRVAVWTGDDGKTGELALQPGWLKEYRKTEHIHSIRDRDFNAAKAELVSWISRTTVPSWLSEATETIARWKAPRRLARLVIEWRGNRFDGDSAMFERLEECRTGKEKEPAIAWRQRDKHLLLYESNLREQLQANRLDLYRCFVANLRKTYAVAVIEGRSSSEVSPDHAMDLRPFHELPADEEPAGALGEKGSRAKEHVRDAACSILRRLLKESMTVLETKPAPNTTRACHICDSIQDWDQAMLVHVCTECGAKWDQDVNASENLVLCDRSSA